MYHALLAFVCLFFSSFIIALPVAEKTSTSQITKRSIAGPVISANFPDPGLIKVDNTWYAFATRTKGTTIHIQIASSSDFSTWSVESDDALPTLPTWVNQSSWNTWAPDVKQLDDGSFIMYFSATTTAESDGSKHCIGVATASSVTGPYTGQDDSLICPLSQGGAIDPAGFVDSDGSRYIVYKIDGNSIGNGGACGNSISPIQSTALLLQPVESDGYTFTSGSSTTTLLDNDGVSDSGVIEGPTLIRTSSGTYILFFSSGCFTTDSYTVSYATASSLTGPYTRASSALLATGDGRGLTAPGGMDVSTDVEHMVFHANNNDGGRSMYTAIISVDGTTVSV